MISSNREKAVSQFSGKQDKIVGSTASEEIAKQLCCELVLYDEFGHAVYEEARDFNQRIYDFFKETHEVVMEHGHVESLERMQENQ